MGGRAVRAQRHRCALGRGIRGSGRAHRRSGARLRRRIRPAAGARPPSQPGPALGHRRRRPGSRPGRNRDPRARDPRFRSRCAAVGARPRRRHRRHRVRTGRRHAVSDPIPAHRRAALGAADPVHPRCPRFRGRPAQPALGLPRSRPRSVGDLRVRGDRPRRGSAPDPPRLRRCRAGRRDGGLRQRGQPRLEREHARARRRFRRRSERREPPLRPVSLRIRHEPGSRGAPARIRGRSRRPRCRAAGRIGGLRRLQRRPPSDEPASGRPWGGSGGARSARRCGPRTGRHRSHQRPRDGHPCR